MPLLVIIIIGAIALALYASLIMEDYYILKSNTR